MSNGPGERKQLGKILLQQKLVTPQELDEMLVHQRIDGVRLASTVASSGKVGEVDLLKALSEQHGLPGIDLTQVVIPLDNLKLIPTEIARQHMILPILVKEDRIFLAMADPSDRRVVDEIEFVTGRRIFPYVALHEPLKRLIDEVYRLAEAGESTYIGPHVPADYLRQLGLPVGDPGQPGKASGTHASPSSPPPEPRPSSHGGAVVVSQLDDELGIDAGPDGAGRSPPLDPAFESRVAPLPTAPQTPKAAPGKRTVLVVDDEDDIRRLLRRVLTERGFTVVEASRGLEALQAVKDHVPDVILLDAMLPEVHGFEICRRIKGSKRYGHIPIVMVSAVYRGWRFAEDLRTSYGVEAFLEKPFKIGDVMAAVERCLGVRGASGDDPDELSGDAQDCLQKGIDAYKAGDLDAAIAHLRRGLGVDPLAFRLHYHLGLLCGRRDENIYEAIQELETAVDLQPKHFAALKNLAVLYQRAGFKHKSIETWERALGSAPDDETKRGIKDHLMSLL